ncbi:hypothetical protein [Streptomyces alfalfae]
MPIEPIPCAPGGTGTPGDGCCSPSIASTPLCRADGTAVLLVVRSGCVACGGPAPTPTVVGWIDPATGVLTPGPAPADVGPCDTLACVETVCRTLCDDADGDGQPDTTYSELWCIRADGSAELVLTYRDDPATPYVPLAPVECEYGCPETETFQLCDDSGPFLRRYTWLNGTASFLDYALDGATPHVISGTVGTCPAEPECESPTTPLATVGLCLADGSPIAVLITRDCDGVATRQGWVHLLTGTYSAGAPPAGTVPCGEASAVGLSGIVCDVDPDTGAVLGLVLVEYHYAPDGSLADVQLLNAEDGTDYILQGVLRNCPAGDEVPEQDLTVLCDTRADGTSVAFLRDWRRDSTGLVTGYTDYTLTGTPYVPDPAGTVGVCQPDAPEPCQAQTILTVCRCDDTDGDGRADAEYVELLAVDCTGALTSAGTYVCDLSASYTPISPVSCEDPDEGAGPALGVQARRLELAVGTSWTAADYAALRSVTATAHTGDGEITTVDGTTTLYRGESVTWAIDKETDAALTGPLTITAAGGVVTVAFTTGVNLS